MTMPAVSDKTDGGAGTMPHGAAISIQCFLKGHFQVQYIVIETTCHTGAKS
jgi:hypothetical protein